jgi:hypothetical protein
MQRRPNAGQFRTAAAEDLESGESTKELLVPTSASVRACSGPSRVRTLRVPASPPLTAPARALGLANRWRRVRLGRLRKIRQCQRQAKTAKL